MFVKASTGRDTYCRGGKQSDKANSFRAVVAPKIVPVITRHPGADPQRQACRNKRESDKGATSPKHLRNIMVGHSPIKCLAENSLLPKHDRNQTEKPKKAYREQTDLNERGGDGKTAASAVAGQK